MTVDGLPSKRPACPDAFKSRAHLSEEEIEFWFKQDFGHSRTFASIQAKLYEVGAGKLRRKKKNIVKTRSQSRSALLRRWTRPNRQFCEQEVFDEKESIHTKTLN
ncbi:hypothetical protein N7444_002060 [Penicillium canescens]|nr:hypothetical protein N7444_002060 [Penicillium canescens]